jgi:hypothetical protein
MPPIFLYTHYTESRSTISFQQTEADPHPPQVTANVRTIDAARRAMTASASGLLSRDTSKSHAEGIGALISQPEYRVHMHANPDGNGDGTIRSTSQERLRQVRLVVEREAERAASLDGFSEKGEGDHAKWES